MNLPICARKFSILTLALFSLSTAIAFAEGTRTWEQSKFEDLVKGSAKGVAIRSTGGLELAPSFKALATTPSTYIWSIAADQSGNLFAGAGSPARVYLITPAGQSTPIFEPQELQVQALVMSKAGVLYAATTPDGKVYRIERRSGADASKQAGASESTWSSSVYFDPGTKYIWDLALDDAGDLYVATGDKGEIYKVTPNGQHSVFFKSDEAHIRSLAFDLKGNLIAGSDGSGLVYRIGPNGDGFVLYSAPKKEITALAIDNAGNIYAAGVGEKRPGAGPMIMPVAPAPASPAGAAGGQPGLVITNVAPAAGGIPGGFPGPGAAAAGGSEIYRIAPDGSPDRIWTSREDLVYALAFDDRGHLLAGTGNRGHIFEIDGEDQFADLLQASAGQITAFAKAPGGGLYASTSNLGKVILLGASPAPEGAYESDVFDTHIFSRWGRAEFRGMGNVEMFARSGNVDNPDRNWSPWKKIDLQKDAEAGIPPARFVQWKAVLHAGPVVPRLDSVLLNYLPKNIAPDFDEVSVQVGVRYQSLPKPVDSSAPPGAPVQHFDSPPPTTRDRDSIGVKWGVHDDNDDQMIYSVYYRGDGETRWLLLKDQLTDKFYSFDASLVPDGGYLVKVVASDAPSHSPGQALTAEKESQRFEVDTTPPQIQSLSASLDAGKIHVTFRAVDSFSALKRAEYSIDAGDWQFVEPVGQLSDSKTESYDFQAPIPTSVSGGAAASSPGAIEHVVVVRAYDRNDNMNSAKFVIRGK